MRPALPRRLVLAAPALWLGLFFLLPLLVVVMMSFAEAVLAVPPVGPLLAWVEGAGPGEWKLQLTLNLASYQRLGADDLYLAALGHSVLVAAESTLGCLLMAYPMAYAMARAPERQRPALLLLAMLPFWTSFLIRVYAWMAILKESGPLNGLLLSLGLIAEPLPLLYTDGAVLVGIIYTYLPFMLLPLYATLEKLDPVLLEAAADLGSRPWRAFLRITLPLSLPGVIAGALLVFIPVVGEFVIPDLLGGPDTLMIGKVLWTEFGANRDWPAAATLAVALLVVILGPMLLFQRVQAREGR